MTKLFIVAILSIYTILNLNGSTNLKLNYQTNEQTVQDTSKYLDYFVNNKAKFQHKELKHLLARLKLTIKSYTPVRNLKKVGERKGIIIYFESKALVSTKMEKQITVKAMYIEFEKPVSLYTDVTDLYNKSNGEWLPAEAAFYGKQIVKDIN
ncbi:hypothetical protein [Pedobacter boryungensis]|uniref:Uncharacterized protein n=1 Tax=Pedobacter boryungensis TaxID=869962 RepID=A0ABX2DF56_9SPHI|nr:hypothetical protein [Pedobacter boryungensis]NQX32437.1 hypothetical protein [Pedobacter boryungensis]